MFLTANLVLQGTKPVLFSSRIPLRSLLSLPSSSRSRARSETLQYLSTSCLFLFPQLHVISSILPQTWIAAFCNLWSAFARSPLSPLLILRQSEVCLSPWAMDRLQKIYDPRSSSTCRSVLQMQSLFRVIIERYILYHLHRLAKSTFLFGLLKRCDPSSTPTPCTHSRLHLTQLYHTPQPCYVSDTCHSMLPNSFFVSVCGCGLGQHEAVHVGYCYNVTTTTTMERQRRAFSTFAVLVFEAFLVFVSSHGLGHRVVLENRCVGPGQIPTLERQP